MARKCRIEDPNRFVLTLPLCCEPWQRDRLDKLFRVGNEIKNHLIAYEKKQLEIVTHRKDYLTMQTQLADAYKAKDTRLKKSWENSEPSFWNLPALLPEHLKRKQTSIACIIARGAVKGA